MKHKQSRFTIIKLMITGVGLGVAASIVLPMISSHSPVGPQEDTRRATENMDAWMRQAGVTEVKRKSCFFDSDGDGKASCTLVTSGGEKIFLEYSSSLINSAINASGCKEVFANFKVGC